MPTGGTLTIDTPSSYTGTTTVAAGTLQTTATGTIGAGALIVSSAGGINSTLSLNNDQTVGSLTGTVAGGPAQQQQRTQWQQISIDEPWQRDGVS